jgi:hypothetical protein
MQVKIEEKHNKLFKKTKATTTKEEFIERKSIPWDF